MKLDREQSLQYKWKHCTMPFNTVVYFQTIVFKPFTKSWPLLPRNKIILHTSVCTKHSLSPSDLGYRRIQPALTRQLLTPANLGWQTDVPLWKRQVVTYCSQGSKWPENDPGNTNISPHKMLAVAVSYRLVYLDHASWVHLILQWVAEYCSPDFIVEPACKCLCTSTMTAPVINECCKCDILSLWMEIDSGDSSSIFV